MPCLLLAGESVSSVMPLHTCQQIVTYPLITTYYNMSPRVGSHSVTPLYRTNCIQHWTVQQNLRIDVELHMCPEWSTNCPKLGQGELARLCLGINLGGGGAMSPAHACYQLIPTGSKCKYIASLHPRSSVRDEEPHTTAGVSVCAEHSGPTVNEKQFPSYGVSAMHV
jgi:hypothetical protein